eukprot:g9867.t1
MDAAGEELATATTATTVSTESPSPVPPPREGSAPSKQHYFRLESLSTLTAPVDEKTAARLARTRTVRLPENLRPPCPFSSGGYGSGSGQGEQQGEQQGNGVEEEKFPIPDNPTAWARYGFLDQAILLQATGQSLSPAGGRRAASLPGGREGGPEAQGGGSSRTLVRVRTDPSASLRADDAERRHHPPAPTIAESTAAETGSVVRPGAEADGNLALDVGSSTPLTDTMTPSSEERRRKGDVAAAGGSGGSGGGPATAASSVSGVAAARNNAGPTTRSSSRRAGGLDSMAASMLASSAAAAAAAAAKQEEEDETKEDDLAALRQQEARQATMDSVDEAQERGKSGPNFRTPQTIAEIERHKRNRAERLRAYGCQRTLYPRIVPGTGGGSGSNSGPEMETEEAETEEWVNTLRVGAALRGESLMAACSQSFAEQRAASLLGEQQLEARASRTADVSQMEGPDGLLHCAVVKGEHALAARAAQFLVDKRGSNVNSRDEWGRTPLHTAAGKGMVAMARFFIRRGANVDARDQDDRTPLFFACASGSTTMARYLTRIEVGARYDLKDKRGHLAGEYFWESVDQGTRDEILAILVAVGWPDPPPSPRNSGGGGGGGGTRGVGGLILRGRASRGGGDGRGRNSSSAPPAKHGRGGTGGRGEVGGAPKRHSEGGEAGMKRLASDMKSLMKRR